MAGLGTGLAAAAGKADVPTRMGRLDSPVASSLEATEVTEVTEVMEERAGTPGPMGTSASFLEARAVAGARGCSRLPARLMAPMVG